MLPYQKYYKVAGSSLYIIFPRVRMLICGGHFYAAFPFCQKSPTICATLLANVDLQELARVIGPAFGLSTADVGYQARALGAGQYRRGTVVCGLRIMNVDDVPCRGNPHSSGFSLRIYPHRATKSGTVDSPSRLRRLSAGDQQFG
jgi:hypothetical protein